MSRGSGEHPGTLARRVRGDRKSVSSGAVTSSSTLDVEFGAAPAWSSWYLMPMDVLMALDEAGFEPSFPYVTGADEARVRRRGDQYLERAGAWSVERDSLVLVDAVRKLDHVRGGKFRPAEPWRLTVRRRPFAGEVRERSGTVAVDPGSLADGNEPSSRTSGPEVIALLPTPVRKQVLATVPNPEVAYDTLTQGTSRGVPADHEAGLIRATAGRMIAVTATRAIRPKGLGAHEAAEALAATPWEVTTVTTRLASEQITELTSDRAKLEQKPAQRIALDGAPAATDMSET